jgi:hypothetical protein
MGEAGDETRTRDNLLGRQALYQLSYSRTLCDCTNGILTCAYLKVNRYNKTGQIAFNSIKYR